MATGKERLSNVDTAWLRMEHPTNPMVIVAVLTLDEPMELPVLKELLRERFLPFKRFQQRVIDPKGTPSWQMDRYFDLDNHVHRLALPAPGDQRVLQELVSDLMSTPLDFARPLWQMHLVDGYRGGSALIMRLHHCIADGIALIHVLLSLTDEYFDATKLPGAPAQEEECGLLGRLTRLVVKAAETTWDTAGSLLGEGAQMVLRPRHLLKRTMQGMSLAASLGRVALLPSDSDTLFKGDLGVRKRVAWSAPMPLQNIKDIGHGADGKVNDVLTAAVAGSLRRYLLAQGQPVEDVNIRALVPVNLRSTEKAFELGNQFGLVFLTLPIGMADPYERLQEVVRRMERLKYSSEAVVIFGLLNGAGMAPAQIERQLIDIFSSKGSAVLTNVPGPRERLHFASIPMRGAMFWVPRAGRIGLGISIFSYADDVLLGVAADVNLVPEPDTLITHFEEEFEELKQRFV